MVKYKFSAVSRYISSPIKSPVLMPSKQMYKTNISQQVKPVLAVAVVLLVGAVADLSLPLFKALLDNRNVLTKVT